jgi:hypothetical protein
MTTPVNRVMLASQAASMNRTKIDHFPANIGSHGMLMVFNEYQFMTPGSRPLLRLPGNVGGVVRQSNGGVLLPIPNTLQDANNVRITGEDMYSTFGAETAASAAAGARQSFEAAGGGMAGLGAVATTAGGSIASAFNQSRMPGPQDALFLARRLFGDNFLLGPISQGVGATINPKASLLFEGVNLKSFNFDWVLAPTEKAESDLIRKLIDRLKSNMLPSYNMESAFTRAMLKYPSTVDIYLLGIDPDYYMFFKTAMVRNVNVNYTPNGLSIIRGGKPASVNLSIELQEMDIHTANDYEYGLVSMLEGFVNSATDSRTNTTSDGATTDGVTMFNATGDFRGIE